MQRLFRGALTALALFTVAATQPPAPDSARALRRARLLVEMRLLELREERLDAAREAILRGLPPEWRPLDRSRPPACPQATSHSQ